MATVLTKEKLAELYEEMKQQLGPKGVEYQTIIAGVEFIKAKVCANCRESMIDKKMGKLHLKRFVTTGWCAKCQDEYNS